MARQATNGREDKRNKTNRRLTLMYADMFSKTSSRVPRPICVNLRPSAVYLFLYLFVSIRSLSRHSEAADPFAVAQFGLRC
jgi:hypothetical protein